jgi:hypothetical protein
LLLNITLNLIDIQAGANMIHDAQYAFFLKGASHV